MSGDSKLVNRNKAKAGNAVVGDKNTKDSSKQKKSNKPVNHSSSSSSVLSYFCTLLLLVFISLATLYYIKGDEVHKINVNNLSSFLELVGFSQSNEVHQENVIDISADTGEVIPSQDSTLGSDKTKDGHVEKTTNVDPKPSDNKQTEPDQPFDHVESMDEPLLDPTVTEGKATPSDDAKEVKNEDEDLDQTFSVFERDPILKARSKEWKEKMKNKLNVLSNLDSLWSLVRQPAKEFDMFLALDVCMASLSLDLIHSDDSKDKKKSQWVKSLPVKPKHFFEVDDIVSDESSIFNKETELGESNFYPYVARAILPPKTRYIIWGDVHGSLISLLTTLESLTHSRTDEKFFKRDEKADDSGVNNKPCFNQNLIIAPHCRLVFLGDFVDRGMRSLEVIFVMSLIRIINGNRVLIVRGNHEDLQLCVHYGLGSEIIHKYPNSKYQVLARIISWFRFFPYALYVGALDEKSQHRSVNFVQMSHGLAEIGFSPWGLLSQNLEQSFMFTSLSEINRGSLLNQLFFTTKGGKKQNLKTFVENNPKVKSKLAVTFVPEGPARPMGLGLCWDDILLEPADKKEKKPLEIIEGRGTAFGVELITNLYEAWSSENVTFRGIIRGHQHNNAAGPMLDRLIESHGFVNLFSKGQGGMQKNKKCREKFDVDVEKNQYENYEGEQKYWLITTISAAESNLDLMDHSYVEIHSAQTWKDWKIDHFWTPIKNLKRGDVKDWNVCTYA